MHCIPGTHAHDNTSRRHIQKDLGGVKGQNARISTVTSGGDVIGSSNSRSPEPRPRYLHELRARPPRFLYRAGPVPCRLSLVLSVYAPMNHISRCLIARRALPFVLPRCLAVLTLKTDDGVGHASAQLDMVPRYVCLPMHTVLHALIRLGYRSPDQARG